MLLNYYISRSFGGEVSWPSSVALGATFDEKDESITHHIVDRPLQGHRFLSRYVKRQLLKPL